jgi:phosphopantetheinyl transferase
MLGRPPRFRGRASAAPTHAVSWYGPIAPTDWRFTTDRRGKPFIATPQRGAPEIAFNLSHPKGARRLRDQARRA